MRKVNVLVLGIFLMLGMVSAKAEQSATGYSNPASFRDQQVFVIAYNNSGSTITRDYAVILDTTATSGSTLGAYVTTTTTTDSVYIFGVADETISAATLGRICIRGPHKVVWASTTKPAAAGTNSVISNTSVTAGTVGPTSTAAGTNHGILGRLLSNTATTDTGDVSGQEYYAWIQPQVEN